MKFIATAAALKVLGIDLVNTAAYVTVRGVSSSVLECFCF